MKERDSPGRKNNNSENTLTHSISLWQAWHDSIDFWILFNIGGDKLSSHQSRQLILRIFHDYFQTFASHMIDKR